MHLGQIKTENGIIAAVFEGGRARPIPAHNMLDLIRRAETQGEPLSQLAAQLASRHGEERPPVLPICPPEVWGCGCTYEASAAFRDAEHGTREGMYAHVYREARPEIFFKGTSRVCVATGQCIGIRPDSKFAAGRHADPRSAFEEDLRAGFAVDVRVHAFARAVLGVAEGGAGFIGAAASP